MNKPELLKQNGPLLIASNHPNSFLDAIIYDILFDVPIWSLARGDVFKRFPKAVPLLENAKIFPVFRMREGNGNLTDNYKTFEACMKVLKKKEAVTIFSEALCVNEWHLRPLKKGTARIAFKAWEQNIDLKVLPAGINYSSFRHFGKKVDINLGLLINANDFNLAAHDGAKHNAFNKNLAAQLGTLVYEIQPGDNETFNSKFNIKNNRLKETLLFIPSLLAVILHLPLYFAARVFTKKVVRDNDHYDAVMLAFLLFTYPFYLIALSVWGWLTTTSPLSFIVLILLPLTVLAYVKRKVRKDNAFTGKQGLN